MKKQIFFSFILLMAFATITFAQKPRPKKAKKTPEEVAQKKTDKMTEVMGLDASTKEKVYAINLKKAQDMKVLRDKVKAEYPDKEVRKNSKDKIKEKYGPEKKEIKKTAKEAIKALVSEEQWKKWQEYKKSQRVAKGKGRRKIKPTDDLED